MDLKITSSHFGQNSVLITETDSNQDRQTRRDALNMDKWFIIL